MHRLINLRVIRDRDRLEERLRRWMDTVFEIDQASPGFRPLADLYETPQGLVLRMEVAGVAASDLSLELAGRELVIRGQRRSSGPAGPTRFFQQEMGFGSFERTFLLPMPIDPQGVTARYGDGILEVILPRQIPQPVQVPIKEA